jgi:LruC domain-containing protein
MKKTFIACMLTSAIIWSCNKTENYDPSTEKGVDSFSELTVPTHFKFETFKTVKLDVSIQNQGFQNDFKVKVYDFLPSAGGNLIYSGFTVSNLSTDIDVPSYLTKLYLIKEDPNGSSSISIVDVTGNNASHTFGKKKRSKAKTTIAISPNCITGCDATYNNHSGNISINNNSAVNTVCVTGTYSGQISINKSDVLLKVCGDATVSTLSLNNGSSLVLTDGASLNVNTLRLNSSGGEITVYDATLTVNNTFAISGDVTNYGIINVSQSNKFNITSSSSEFINSGTLNVFGDAQVSNDFTNNGSMNVTGNLQFNSNSTGVNNCYQNISGSFMVNGTFDNYSLIEVTGDLEVSSVSNVSLYDGAMIISDNATLNGGITGSGTTSLVKVENTTVINATGFLSGNLEYCDTDGIETLWGNVNAPASLACNIYIPTSACNTIGNGTTTVSDSDNDGIADGNDLFPNDPDRAGESYYPGSSQYGTIAFEDLWPGKGDYDFNDLVVNYRFRMITDANNDIKDIEINYAVMAIGGSLSNGFGIQFDVAPSAIESVVGTQYFENNITLNANGTEANQSKAVVVLFDNAFGILTNLGTQTVNTDPTNTFVPVDTNRVRMTLTSPVAEAQLPFNSFNPFIFIGQNRGKELHLSGKEATDLMDINFFGTADDDSDPSSGRFFVTENDLPWAIQTAQIFDYPVEQEDIVKAYSLFSTWAQSGGNSSLDWYLNLPGYRDNTKVY